MNYVYTESHINQDRMIFADFSVNSQQIMLKFCKHYFFKRIPTARINMLTILKVRPFDMK